MNSFSIGKNKLMSFSHNDITEITRVNPILINRLIVFTNEIVQRELLIQFEKFHFPLLPNPFAPRWVVSTTGCSMIVDRTDVVRTS